MIDKEQPKYNRPRKDSSRPQQKLQSDAPTAATSLNHSPAKPESETEKVIALLPRERGATPNQLVTLTDWRTHTTRAALTGLKKKGLVISSEKTDGVRRYPAVKAR